MQPTQKTKNKRTVWYTVSEAAYLLGLTERAIQIRAKKGTLEKKMIKSPETGRMKLLVTSPELTEKAELLNNQKKKQINLEEDFVPRFSKTLEAESSLSIQEMQEISAHLKSLDEGLKKERDELKKLEAERDRLAKELAQAKAALETERELSSKHEKSLHRFIDRQEERFRQKEEKLLKQVSLLARELGRAEHQILLLKSKKPWYKRLFGIFFKAK